MTNGELFRLATQKVRELLIAKARKPQFGQACISFDQFHDIADDIVRVLRQQVYDRSEPPA